jgi:S-adenosylmethionine:tRNA ribosyltransferase-isomerase
MPDLLDLDTYDYHLPPELIAQYPLPERDSSRLLHLDRSTGSINHLRFPDIVDLLYPGDVLVLNNSKVIPARLYGAKASGTRIEIFLLHNIESNRWKCMVHPGKRLKLAQKLSFSDTLSGWVSLPDADGLREIEFACEGDFWDELEQVGHVPLPPYIRRKDEEKDRRTYQTVYASQPGSVAAPTAGLHFTPELLDSLRDKGVILCELMLHVGMGTFLPVKTPRIDEHKMHSEFCTITEEVADLVNRARTEGCRIIPVGSTAMRTLESFQSEGVLRSGSQWTDIFIYPGRKIRMADALVTNFHLPKSSLLMLISAFAGLEQVKRAYRSAVEERYRFFSYGDAMFIT